VKGVGSISAHFFLLLIQNQLVMTKYELLEETNEIGETIYFIEKDGQYLEGSIKLDLERAKEVYEQVRGGIQVHL
jgi:hypothetical protein